MDIQEKQQAALAASRILNDPAVVGFLRDEKQRLYNCFMTLPPHFSKEVLDAYRTMHFALHQLKRFESDLNKAIMDYAEAQRRLEDDARMDKIADGV